MDEGITTPKKLARKLQQKQSPKKQPLRCVDLNQFLSEEKPC
jgi:hypothetical protein